MCTLTVVPSIGGFRVAVNRDAQLLRPAAQPPVTYRIGGVLATFPVDPVGRGTWVAANEAGLVLALLNRHPSALLGPAEPGDKAAGRQSRGEIIPRFIGARRLATLRDELSKLNLTRYAPFQLVGVYGRGVLLAVSNGCDLHVTTDVLREPLMFTSSSLGDHDARRVRKPLFDSLVARSRDRFAGQRRFHDHSWPGCPTFSVRMLRPDARTVSRSVIDVHKRRVTFGYEAAAD